MGAQSQIRGILSLCRARLGKELALVALGQVASAIGTLVSLRVLTELLSPHEFGNVALGLTITMLMQYAYMGVSASLLKYYAAATEGGFVKALIRGVWKVQASRHGVLVGMLLVGIGVVMATQTTDWFVLGIPCAIAAVILQTGVVYDSIQLASRNRAMVAILAAATPWVTLLCQVVCIGLVGHDARAALMGTAFGAAALLPIRVWASKRKVRELVQEEHEDVQAQPDYYGMMRAYALPWLIWSFPTWIQLNADRWALETLRGTSDVGVYASYSQLAIYPITMLTQVLLQFVQPILYNRVGTGTDAARLNSARRLNLQLVRASLIWTVVMSTVVFAFSQPIVDLLLASRYRAEHMLLGLLVISSGLYATSNFAALLITTSEETQKLVAPRVTSALVGSALVAFGAWRYGAIGVAVASAIAWLFYTVWILIKADVKTSELLR
jgi:O-antigen/teichoic acid export membrane protein